MKIAIPANDKDWESGVCASFGRARYLAFYDTQTQSGVFVENPAAKAAGGAGLKAAQAVVDAGAGALLAARCGQNAAEVLQEAGIAVYRSLDGTMQENLAAFSEGKLVRMTQFQAGFHAGA